MKTKATLILAAAGTLGLLVACDNNKNTTQNTGKPADNTATNKRDRDNNTKTPMDQSNSQSDVKISADIRKAVLDDSSLSTNAHECKIITVNGVVTLRGVVASQAEKDSIESKAKAVAGVSRVDNQLDVEPPK